MVNSNNHCRQRHGTFGFRLLLPVCFCPLRVRHLAPTLSGSTARKFCSYRERIGKIRENRIVHSDGLSLDFANETRRAEPETCAHYLNLIQIAVSGIKTDAEAAWANLLKRPTVKPRDFLDLCDLLPYDKILNRGHLYTAEPDAIRSKTAPSWSLKLPIGRSNGSDSPLNANSNASPSAKFISLTIMSITSF